MSWGTDLWDQFANICDHTQKNIEFCEKIAKFTKERCDIENEYAAKLKRLVKTYQPKKKEEDDYKFTCAKGFLDMTKEVNDIANQHELISENLQTTVFKDLNTLTTEAKQEKKKLQTEGQSNEKKLHQQLEKLEQVRKNYEKAFKESVKAKEAFEKADKDIQLSRADVEKAKAFSQQQAAKCDQCKFEYATELGKTNEAQKTHYEVCVPQVFQQFQELDRRRIEKCREVITQCGKIQRDVMPIVSKCIEGMEVAAISINAEKDLRMVVDQYQSGLHPPGDVEFIDLSVAQSLGNSNPSLNNKVNGKSKGVSTIGKKFQSKTQRRGLTGLFQSPKVDESKEDYSHLPPLQQKKELQKKLDVIRKEIAKETGERDGLIKMRDVYSKNTALGDPKSVEKKMEENAKTLDSLNAELKKYEQYLDHAMSGVELPQLGVQRRPSDKSQSSSNTDSQPGTPQQPRVNISSPDKAERSVESQESGDVNDSFDDQDEVGECKAVYNFEGSNEGSLPMKEGESFYVIESDQGDGWTRVRRKNNDDEGFVPTSYLKITLF